MATFIAHNINWDIDIKDAFEALDDMPAYKAAEAIDCPKEKYVNMTTSERHDYAYDLWRHSPASLEEFMDLPSEVEIPAEFDIKDVNAEMSDVTDWLSDTFGFCIKGYDVYKVE